MKIVCEKCGGQNILPEGRNSMFCSFCGSSIEQPAERVKMIENPIKVKPVITEKKERTWTETVAARSGRSGRRVSGGYELTNDSWERVGISPIFIPDEVKHHEEVLDEGGELRLTNKGLKSIKNVTEWFTDSELETVRILDLSNNLISDLSGIEKMKNIQELNLSDNQIKTFPKAELLKLREINLSNNQLTVVQPLFSSYMIQKVILDNNSISDLVVDKDNIYAIKRRFLTVTKKILSGPLSISLKNNPVESFEFFSQLVAEMSDISADDLSDNNRIKSLAANISRANGKNDRDSKIKYAQEFLDDYNAIIDQTYIINHIEISIDQEIQEYGFDKIENDLFVYKVAYPPEEVILDALRQETKNSSDILKLMEETANSMSRASRNMLIAGITLGIYIIFCFWLYSYSQWMFYVQVFIIGIPIIIYSLGMLFKQGKWDGN